MCHTPSPEGTAAPGSDPSSVQLSFSDLDDGEPFQLLDCDGRLGLISQIMASLGAEDWLRA